MLLPDRHHNIDIWQIVEKLSCFPIDVIDRVNLATI